MIEVMVVVVGVVVVVAGGTAWPTGSTIRAGVVVAQALANSSSATAQRILIGQLESASRFVLSDHPDVSGFAITY
ncbi:hypothetical protein [Kibdelosporangium phytohabitans]|uniref:Uncharacterized protein n=1 Tax=Kibdelosporangium phytohabitans TaxID=860235 RepID=A0A0N9HRQ6_9PSEU|nr:hypothetical protein [Kibdelosporangium phytohabitans]ALG05820.1 hypothetical protein AOZ06_01785 [Kibdelosporangium phytohabitans]MBE1466161.1 hypothetical protein [Kibdelosporangium phytohabitans]